MRLEVRAQGLGQTDDGELAGVVDAEAAHADQAAYGRGVDDMGFAAMAHELRQERGDAVDDAAKIDPEHPIPVAKRHLVQRARHIDAGIVEQQVHGPVPGDDVISRRGERAAIGDIEQHRRRLDMAGSKRRGSPIESLLLDVGDDDAGPGETEDVGYAEADAAGPASDEGGFVADAGHVRVSSVVALLSCQTLPQAPVVLKTPSMRHPLASRRTAKHLCVT